MIRDGMRFRRRSADCELTGKPTAASANGLITSKAVRMVDGLTVTHQQLNMKGVWGTSPQNLGIYVNV